MLSNILIALGFMGTGILIGLGLAVFAIMKTKKGGKEKTDDDIRILIRHVD